MSEEADVLARRNPGDKQSQRGGSSGGVARDAGEGTSSRSGVAGSKEESIFGGIGSVGGCLCCKHCNFEALNITLLMKHKETHHSSRVVSAGEMKREVAAISKEEEIKNNFMESLELRPLVKEVEVPDAPMTGDKNNNDDINTSGTSRREDSFNERKRNGGHSADSSFADGYHSDEKEQMATNLSRPRKRKSDCVVGSGSVRKLIKKNRGEGTPRRAPEVSYPKSTDTYHYDRNNVSGDSNTDIDDAETSLNLSGRVIVQPAVANHIVRREGPLGLFGSVSGEDLRSRFAQFEGRSRQRVTTTEAEDAAGMSKRKRKLRACAKCGYVTDNLTTLQRHAAKHGSGGRHQCLRCDYRWAGHRRPAQSDPNSHHI